MMRRGLKRKLDKILDNFEEEPDPYQQGLGDFQSAARRRESMRIKNQVNVDNTDSTNNCRLGVDTISWEKSLQNQIHVEQQMLEGTAKFVTVCKNEQQLLEGAKSLQLGRLRLEMLRYELARLKRGRGSPQSQMQLTSKTSSNSSDSKVLARPSYAGVSLSDIRIPLMWKRKDHLNDAGDKRKFSVFCIARIGSQIYDTRLINNIDRTMTDVTIDDVILFSRVAPHFELTLELYARLVDDGGSVFPGSSVSVNVATSNAGQMLLATPQKICRSISKAVGKKFAENNFSTSFFDKDETFKKKKNSSKTSSTPEDPYFTKVGPKFDMIASATLTLEDCSNEIKSFEFYIEEFRPIGTETVGSGEQSRANTLPLFGQFCGRLAALPYCCESPVLTGKVCARKVDENDAVRSRGAESMWGRLMDWNLSLWSEEQEFIEGALPLVQIPVNRDTCILEEDNNVILVINHVKDETDHSDNQMSLRSRPKSVAWRSPVPLKKTTWELSFPVEQSCSSSKENSNPGSQSSYDSWLVHLLQHAADHRRWKSVATNKMDVYSPGGGNRNKASSSSLISWNLEPTPSSFVKPEKEVTFQFPRMSSFNPSSAKRQKREAKKSFRRTRSKLVLLYNQTGAE